MSGLLSSRAAAEAAETVRSIAVGMELRLDELVEVWHGSDARRLRDAWSLEVIQPLRQAADILGGPTFADAQELLQRLRTPLS